MLHANRRAILLVSTAMAATGLADAAFAQAQTTTNPNALEEVVVTATRQTSTVNKVALSVSAVTQKSLDQQGIRNVQDLSQQIPGFSFRTTGGDNNPQLTIRGIGGNAIGGTSGSAPTTGVYIDDLPVMKRNANGLLTGSGSPVPLLYDLDRIEVLRGPQGTLYGGSSEGGTLRFITPQPSLTTYSGSARVGASTMAGGGYGDEEGLALGGPIVQDKLGFRISGFRQQRPGWVDSFSEYDGHKFSSNNNWGTDYSLHGSVLWQVTPAFKATLGVFHQMNYDNDGPSVRGPSPATNIPVRTFANCGYVVPGGTTSAQAATLLSGMGKTGCGAVTTAGATVGAAGTAGPVNGVSFSFPATVFGGYTIPAQTWFSNYDGNSTGRYLTPSNPQYVSSPRRTIFTIPSLTLDYNWNDKLAFKSITAYTDDRTSGWQFTGGFGMRTSVFPNYTGQPCPSGPGLQTPILTAANACTVAPQYLQLPANLSTMYPGQLGNQQAGPADVFGYYLYNNRRGQTTQEFRVTTTDPSWRVQFVLGAFIEHEHNHVNVGSSWDETTIAKSLRGVDEAYFAGGGAAVPVMQVPGALPIDVSTRNIDILEDEQSVFADVTFAVTSKFKIEAGVRATNYQQAFAQQYGGDVAGAPTGFVGTSANGQTVTVGGVTSPFETNPNSLTPIPTNYAACPPSVKAGAANGTQYAKAGCPYQYTGVVLKEQPITPKVGASYQLTPGDMVYVTYAEGQRPGGINPPAPAVQCAQDFATLGITSTPQTYQHDTVKSTEVGGKFRLFNGQAQINASAFHIEWDGVQFNVSLPLCAFAYIANAAKAYSDGGEIQATGRLWNFTVNGNLGYNNARYAATVRNLNGTVLANKGDNLGVPDWTANIGVQYDTRVMEFPVYGRIDYSYTGKYMRSTGPGSSSFNTATSPNTINGNEIHNMNARVGFYYKDLEVAGYVKNLFNSNEWISKGEGSGNYWFAGSTVTPRVIGVQMNYRF